MQIAKKVVATAREMCDIRQMELVQRVEKIRSALEWLRGNPSSGPFCWCGVSRGHSLGNCHKCGQPFSTPGTAISRGGLMLRWRRRPTNPRFADRRNRDEALAMFGNWRYQSSWPDQPDWNEYQFEDFQRALELFEKEVLNVQV